MKIVLPSQVNAGRLLSFLSAISSPCNDGEIIVDFQDLQRITPVGMVSLVAAVMRWRQKKIVVAFHHADSCRITGYLQRMNVFQACGFDFPEHFTRYPERGRFVPVRAIDHQVEDMGSEMAACLAPGGEDYDHAMSGLYDLAWYVLTETANNIRQHSMGLGFAAAQINGREGLVRIALADNGKGILRSFQDVGLTWSAGLSDADAIEKALQPFVSCKGRPSNEGVGLSLVSRLASMNSGWLFIVSGNGVLISSPGNTPVLSTLPHNGYYQGTIIGLTFRAPLAHDFSRLLHEAKLQAGLLPKHPAKPIFLP